MILGTSDWRKSAARSGSSPAGQKIDRHPPDIFPHHHRILHSGKCVVIGNEVKASPSACRAIAGRIMPK